MLESRSRSLGGAAARGKNRSKTFQEINKEAIDTHRFTTWVGYDIRDTRQPRYLHCSERYPCSMALNLLVPVSAAGWGRRELPLELFAARAQAITHCSTW